MKINDDNTITKKEIITLAIIIFMLGFIAGGSVIRTLTGTW